MGYSPWHYKGLDMTEDHIPRARGPQSEKPAQREASTLQLVSSPHSSSQLEKAHAQQQRPAK